MSYTYHEIVSSRSEKKRLIDKQDLWVFFVVRPISFVITWVIMKLKITANQATGISILVSIVGFLLLITKNTHQTIIALVILNFWIIFDCVDGNIARTTKKSSIFGEFFDGFSGYIFTVLLYIGLSINVYLNSSSEFNWIYLVMGSFTSIATIFPRLIEHKATNMFPTYKREVTDRAHYSLFYIIGLNVAGMAGLSNPLMIIMFSLNSLNLYVIAYFIIHSSIAILTVFKIFVNLRKISDI